MELSDEFGSCYVIGSSLQVIDSRLLCPAHLQSLRSESEMVLYRTIFLSDVKMGLIIFLFLLGVLFICDGFHVLGPSGPLIVKLGGSVMLPCYVEAPISPEELKVEWKRTDSETLVHLFQDRESKPEAQDPAYSGRASFFTEEVKHGNFSLLVTNLVADDAGVYNCTVYRQQDTGHTSVEIEYLIVTGGHAVSAYAREDITLNCSVDSHIPPEQLEVVSWRKVDQDITVLVFQEGVIQTDFTHERFRDRVEFFGPEEIFKGNFSLRIKTLRMEDKGQYRCEVLSGEVSAHTTVEIHLELLLEAFGLEYFQHRPILERAHRLGRSVVAGGTDSNKSRPFIMLFQSFQDKEFFRRSRDGVGFRGHNIRFFQDYSADVSWRRATFRAIKAGLYKEGVQVSMLYPTRLCVVSKDGFKFSEIPDAAQAFVKDHFNC
ncbi:uncharacterized protein LOC118803430 [Colossoma macropomum]|uniref:uncharacterized protein LOC118803430 n=1 Tax=Colossoma macropomum TaxID=42526 RepID=UPI001863FC53|nr:uncharacterized protein LOC118803430 [Colossoma macropomum]